MKEGWRTALELSVEISKAGSQWGDVLRILSGSNFRSSVPYAAPSLNIRLGLSLSYKQ